MARLNRTAPATGNPFAGLKGMLATARIEAETKKPKPAKAFVAKPSPIVYMPPMPAPAPKMEVPLSMRGHVRLLRKVAEQEGIHDLRIHISRMGDWNAKARKVIWTKYIEARTASVGRLALAIDARRFSIDEARDYALFLVPVQA